MGSNVTVTKDSMGRNIAFIPTDGGFYTILVDALDFSQGATAFCANSLIRGLPVDGFGELAAIIPGHDDDEARFLDLSDKAHKLSDLHALAVGFGCSEVSASFRTAIGKTLADLAEIVERSAGGDA